MTDYLQLLLWFAFGSFVLLSISWCYELGVIRGALSALCRIGWIAPLILAAFPRTVTESGPRSLARNPIHVLVDDSKSVTNENEGTSFTNQVDATLKRINEECLDLGCYTKKTLLSELSDEVENGYTPLSAILKPWLYSAGNEPWMIITDGGDFRPDIPWDDALENIAVTSQQKTRGAIIGLKPQRFHNIWIEIPDRPLFSFADKTLNLEVSVNRESFDLSEETVQLQVLSGPTVLTTLNTTFNQGENRLEVGIAIPGLAKGQHLLTVKALPTNLETVVWDNIKHKGVEVLPNTIGILHLLGAPSWDGRFLRRYLKSEPKYDLISFFILRDPGDLQLVNERELSLIPFPVHRLFTQELTNFKVIILQNFALYQFLEPEYQQNLVNFVKNGGGLLFMGGPRALKPGDYIGSPLAEIIPFNSPSGPRSLPADQNFLGALQRDTLDLKGPYYDENLNYQINLAKPSPDERALASIFDDVEILEPALASQKKMSGIHHMENVELKPGGYTPLLNAQLDNGGSLPLAIASYPDKGRAVWLFSDNLWNLSLNPDQVSSKSAYTALFSKTISWLLREEINKPIMLKNLSLVPDSASTLSFEMFMQGPALKYLAKEKSWHLRVCGEEIPAKDLVLELKSDILGRVSGKAPKPKNGSSLCEVDFAADHKAFGSVRASLYGVIPNTYKDSDVPFSTIKLKQLGQLTGAPLFFPEPDGFAAVDDWLRSVSDEMSTLLPPQVNSAKNYYWMLDSGWIYALFAFLPLEVIIRRLKHLTYLKKSRL
ncbi:MAG: hypothetical protein AB7T49_18520 [Oligoflexales bacterium]